MTEFTKNNAKNTSTDHILFKLNCKYHIRIFLKVEINLHSISCSAHKLANKLKELKEICY